MFRKVFCRRFVIFCDDNSSVRQLVIGFVPTVRHNFPRIASPGERIKRRVTSCTQMPLLTDAPPLPSRCLHPNQPPFFTCRYIINVMNQLITFCTTLSQPRAPSSPQPNTDVQPPPQKAERQDLVKDLHVLELLIQISQEMHTRTREGIVDTEFTPDQKDTHGRMRKHTSPAMNPADNTHLNNTQSTLGKSRNWGDPLWNDENLNNISTMSGSASRAEAGEGCVCLQVCVKNCACAVLVCFK